MKIALSYNENLHFKATIRHFTEINLDEPYSFHGTDLGPSSVEYFLIGIGGCLGTTFIYCLQKKKILLDKLEIIVDGKLSHIDPIKRLGLREVEVNIQYEPQKNSSLKKIEDCIKEFQEHCIISNSIKEGFPIKVNYINVT
jgi:uncharacterized OsmC-like protein